MGLVTPLLNLLTTKTKTGSWCLCDPIPYGKYTGSISARSRKNIEHQDNTRMADIFM